MRHHLQLDQLHRSNTRLADPLFPKMIAPGKKNEKALQEILGILTTGLRDHQSSDYIAEQIYQTMQGEPALPRLETLQDIKKQMIEPFRQTLVSGPNVQGLFEQKFADLAADKKSFDQLMSQVYGDHYNAKLAENYRQRSLVGDFSWLPKIKFVDASTLQGANGAYDSKQEVVYLNKALQQNGDLLAQTYLEETGHYLDAHLNQTDTAGDEGELFRRLLNKEPLSPEQISAIRSEDDHGTITVNGRSVKVEFWNPFKKVAKAVKKAVKGVAKGVKSVAKGLAKGAKTFVSGVKGGLGGFLSNLFKGKFKKAFKALGHGANKAFLQTPGHVLSGSFKGLREITGGTANLMGPLGKPLKWTEKRTLGAVQRITEGTWAGGARLIRSSVHGVGTAAEGLGKIFKGDFQSGWQDIKQGVVKSVIKAPLDSAQMTAIDIVGAVQTMTGLEPSGRLPTQEEINALRPIFGDSIDYNALSIKEGRSGLVGIAMDKYSAFVRGNTIYLKNKMEGEDSMALLAHEMVHIWQYRNGDTNQVSLSQTKDSDYYWWESIPAKPWNELKAEQQAEFIGDAYSAGFFNPEKPNYGVFKFNGTDYTAYLNAALQQIKSGKGAA